MGWIRTTHQLAHWQRDWALKYRRLPNTEEEIVFLGDSITASAPWAQYFSLIRNRGIGGETTDGAMQRLEEIIESRPAAVFIHLGTNDLSKEVSVDEVADNMRQIVETILLADSSTRVFIAGLMPINFDFRDDVRLRKKQRAIPVLNVRFKEIASENPRVEYIDLYQAVVDEGGSLKRDMTNDGLHPNDDCYEVLMGVYTPFVQQVHPRMPRPLNAGVAGRSDAQLGTHLDPAGSE